METDGDKWRMETDGDGWRRMDDDDGRMDDEDEDEDDDATVRCNSTQLNNNQKFLRI